jgi:RIO-like serine/threonine protein kinase
MLDVTVTPGGLLGSGSYGHVFRVRRTNDPDQELVLKLVMGEKHTDQLKGEYETMERAAAKCPLHVMGVEGFQKVPHHVGVDSKIGGAMLLSQVATPIKQHSIQSCKKILESLFELHQNGFTHGDPLVQNMLELKDGSFRWIDFEPNNPNPAMFQRDLEDLITSMLNTDAVPQELEEKILLYSKTDMKGAEQEVCREEISTMLSATLTRMFF